MSFSLACQTITWGDGQRERFDEIFARIAASGFQGVEIGFRHVRRTPPEELKTMLARHGLVLFATHLGGNLDDTVQADGERRVLDSVLDYVERAGASHVLYSGLRDRTEEDIGAGIAMLNRAARASAARGVRLLYHNHHWEFIDGHIIAALLAGADDELGLCPDVGWMMRGGARSVDFLEANAARIGAVHFKDFATAGDGTVSQPADSVPLGTGVAPLREVAAWLRGSAVAREGPFWVVAEQDRHDGPPESAVGINGRFLAGVLTERGVDACTA
jgi:sugar phosphate isomerase/epimerase